MSDGSPYYHDFKLYIFW